MTDFLEKPETSDAPTSKAEMPWKKRIEYKSGKTPEGFATNAEPEQVKAGFTYYDKDEKANFQVTGFTASIVAILSGVSGTVPNGQRYDNYWSTMVQDTRYQKLAVFLGSGDNRVTVASGIYNDFKGSLPDGVGYMKYAVVYIHETQECALMELTASFENAIKEAIANQTGQNPAKINVFNLFELSSKYWAIRFSGEFTKRNRDGGAWSGKGDMFFYPSLVAGVVLTEKFPILGELSDQVAAYVNAGQKWFNSAPVAANPEKDAAEQAARVAALSTPSPARSITASHESGFGPVVEVGFPSAEPPEDHTQGPLPTDDLPF